jgi:hypothetical protein
LEQKLADCRARNYDDVHRGELRTRVLIQNHLSEKVIDRLEVPNNLNVY